MITVNNKGMEFCAHGKCMQRVSGDEDYCPAHAPEPQPEPTLAEWRASQYTREQWLNEQTGHLLDLFTAAYAPDWQPPLIRVSCGWPGVAPGGRVDCVKGVCYTPAGSADGYTEIFVSPMLSDAYDVLSTLAHEVTHAIAGVEHNHDETYAATGALIGMAGTPTQLLPDHDLECRLRSILDRSPAYPHGSLNPPPPQPGAGGKTPEPQTGRLLKATCPTCGYVIRLTMKWASRGMPVCPFDHVAFTLHEKKEESK